MELHRLYLWICFFFCLGLTAAGVLVFFRKKEKRAFLSFRLLQYFLIMMYMFGFYGMWSKIFFRLFFHSEPTSENILAVSDFLALIGTPFLIAGLTIFVTWALSLLQKKPKLLLISMAMLVMLFMLWGAYQQFDLLLNIAQLFALVVLGVMLFTSCCLGFLQVQYLDKNTKYILVLLIFFSGAIQVPLFLDILTHPVSELIFIFSFFLTHTAVGVYFVYTARFPEVKKDPKKAVSFDGFLQQYGITARESEVIREIYKGKTNQEIADTLFVTIQTIKDHTHRIYQKTQVKNRTQLASLLRKFER